MKLDELEARGYLCQHHPPPIPSHIEGVSSLKTVVKPHPVMFSWEVPTLCSAVGTECWGKQGMVDGESQEAQV